MSGQSTRTRFRCRVVLLAAVGLVAASQPLPPPVPGFPIGWCLRAKPETFADARSAGFEYVELALQDILGLTEQDFQQLAGVGRAVAPKMLSGYNPIPNDLKLVGPEADKARQDAHLDLLLRRAAALELQFVIFNSGAAWRVPDGVSAETAFADLVAFSRRFAEAAAGHKIMVLLEPLRSTDSNMITTVADALRLIKAVNHPNFELMVDYSFLRIQKEDMNVLRETGGHLRHVHIANPSNPRTYPMDPQESDYASFFRLLKAIGYRGGLSVHAGTSAFATDAPRAITFLRTQARELAR